jgi:cell division protein FtsW
LISLGSGGLLGKGLDNSTQKLEFLPEPFTDFIFAIVGEEFGFLGAALVLTLFLVLVIQGLRIARNCDDDAGALLASGITASIALYTFLNAGVVTNLLPTKGLPMPFISFGGSFMITTLAGIGILLNISQHHEIKLLRRRPAEARLGRLRQNRRRIG